MVINTIFNSLFYCFLLNIFGVMGILDNTFLLTMMAILLPISLRFLFLRMIRKNNTFLSDGQRRWMSLVKNINWIIIAIFLLVLWWPQVQHFAVSITAVALALVLATKELILCFSGALLRTSTQAFVVGDWIELDQIRGEVIEQAMLSTVIHEIDMENNSYNYTGRTITLPNSIFLSQPIRNMNFLKQYVYHRFQIVVDKPYNPFYLKPLILEKAREYSVNFSEVGKRYNAWLEHRMGLDLPTVEPRVYVDSTELGQHVFIVVMFCPTTEAVELEQRLRQDFLHYLYTLRWKQREAA